MPEENGCPEISDASDQFTVCGVAANDDAECQIANCEGRRLLSRRVDRVPNRRVTFSIQAGDHALLKDCRGVVEPPLVADLGEPLGLS